MKIVAIDSSGLVASVAIIEDDNLIAEYNVSFKKTHSQTLLPMLDELKKMVELDLSTVDGIAISKGPGSFTGLRIGSATAKGLSQALNIPIVEIGTLQGMACNLYGSDSVICPIMDARRAQVYTGIYTYDKDMLPSGYVVFKQKTLLEESALPIEELVTKVSQIAKELDKDVIFLGDGVPVFNEYISNNIDVPYSYAPAHMNRQRSASFGHLAVQYMLEGKTVSCYEHAPEYLRLSQAERERNEGIRNKGSNY